MSDNNHVLLISDRNQNLELSLYDCSSQAEEKILSSRYMPAGVQLLVDESGFSFIDDGILCIKRFDRRSVHMVEPDAPLYDIERIHWLDDEFCYFHAKRAGRNGIYTMNVDGVVRTLLEGTDSIDYIYPQIVEQILFCIVCKKDEKGQQFSMYAAPYQEIIKNHETVFHSIVAIGTNPLALLHMISAEEGFCLEYTATRDSKDQLFPFTCYHFFLNDGNWKSEALFTFLIPSCLLFDPADRLYESLLPLAPCYYSPFIYYCSASAENNKLALYSFSMETKKSQLLKQENYNVLAPHIIDNMLIYGGQIKDDQFNEINMLQIAG